MASKTLKSGLSLTENLEHANTRLLTEKCTRIIRVVYSTTHMPLKRNATTVTSRAWKTMQNRAMKMDRRFDKNNQRGKHTFLKQINRGAHQSALSFDAVIADAASPSLAGRSDRKTSFSFFSKNS